MQNAALMRTVRRSGDAASKARIVVPTKQFLFVQLETV
jgi:hypothetical protein